MSAPAGRPRAERRIARRVLVAYVRGQLVTALVFALLATVALLVLDVRYPFTLGMYAGVMSLFPVLGPIFGAAPAVLVTLLLDQDLERAMVVALAFVLLNLLDELVISPRVHADALRVPAPLVLVAVPVAAAVPIVGWLAMLVIVPLIVIARDVRRYRRLVRPPDALPPHEALARLGYD